MLLAWQRLVCVDVPMLMLEWQRLVGVDDKCSCVFSLAEAGTCKAITMAPFWKYDTGMEAAYESLTELYSNLRYAILLKMRV